MPATLTITQINEPEFMLNNPRDCYEVWKATGTASAANDTGTLKTKLSTPSSAYIIGGVGLVITSVSGQTLTITGLTALASNSTVFELHSRAGSGMS